MNVTFETVIGNMSALLLTSFALAAFIVGVFLAANHSWKEGEEEKFLILAGLRKIIEKLADWLDRQVVSAYGRALFFFAGITTLLVLITWKFFHSGDISVLWGYLWAVGYIGISKTYRDLAESILSCYRCMVTFWFGAPLTVFGTVAGFYISPEYFRLIPLAYFLVGTTSAFATVLYMVYSTLKTKTEVNVLAKEALALDIKLKKIEAGY